MSDTHGKEQQDLPDSECSKTPKQKDYRGTKAVTKNGEKCIKWDNDHWFKYSPSWYPSAGLDNNYCRNPADDKDQVWCYTDRHGNWRYCDVPECATSELHTNIKDLNSKIDEVRISLWKYILRPDSAQLQKEAWQNLLCHSTENDEVSADEDVYLKGWEKLEAKGRSDSWVRVAGRFLKFVATKLRFRDARRQCKSFGGVIVQDDTYEINEYLTKKGGQQWIGASDADLEGEWVWTDGSPVGNGHWYPGEPKTNDAGKKTNCAVINFKEPGKWDDSNCNNKRPFHCQVNEVPIPTYTRALKVFGAKKSWKNAAAACQAEGAELVKVDDEGVSEWIAKQKNAWVWVGATDQDNEGKFVWADGSAAVMANWNGANPNNYRNSHCAAVDKSAGWDDRACSNKQAFVCQVDLPC